MVMHITPVYFNKWLQSLDTQLNEPIIQNLIKDPQGWWAND